MQLSAKKFVSGTSVYLSSCECSTMDAANPPPSKIEVHSVMKFLTKENCTSVDIYRRLCSVYGAANVLSVRSVERWQRRTNVEDEDQKDDQATSLTKQYNAHARSTQ